MTTDNMFFDLPKNRSAAIKVIGVGGGGSNAVNFMYSKGIAGVDFVVCNTDAQALNSSPIPNKIQLGVAITEGLGAGANPEVGERSAIESIEEIGILMGTQTKMVFITAGMGGGTGTGAAPIIAGLAKERGILTVGIVTAPFQFEGKNRLDQAHKGIEKLRKNVDALIVVNNNKLTELYGNLGYKSGFAKADEVLSTAAKSIAEVITRHYTQNIDLEDARTILANSGTAIMGSGFAEGENRAKEAVVSALDSPLLNDNKISGAKKVLLLIISPINNEVTIEEIGIINSYIQQEAGNHANIIMGVGDNDTEQDNSLTVTVVATGFPVDDGRFEGKAEKQVTFTLAEDQPITKTFTIAQSSDSDQEQDLSQETFYLEDEDEDSDVSEKSITVELSTQKESDDVEDGFEVSLLEDETPSGFNPTQEIIDQNRRRMDDVQSKITDEQLFDYLNTPAYKRLNQNNPKP